MQLYYRGQAYPLTATEVSVTNRQLINHSKQVGRYRGNLYTILTAADSALQAGLELKYRGASYALGGGDRNMGTGDHSSWNPALA